MTSSAVRVSQVERCPPNRRSPMASISVVSRMPRGRSAPGAADGDPARGRHSGVFIVKAGAISPPALGGGRDTPRVPDVSTFVPTQRVARDLALAGRRFSLVGVPTVSRHEAALGGACVFDPELATLACHHLNPPRVSRETSPFVQVPTWSPPLRRCSSSQSGSMVSVRKGVSVVVTIPVGVSWNRGDGRSSCLDWFTWSVARCRRTEPLGVWLLREPRPECSSA